MTGRRVGLGWESFRRGAGAFAVDGFFRAASNLGRLHPRAKPQHHGVERLADIPYRAGGDRYHRLDIYRPRHAHGPLPVVFYVHGGGFRILSKDTHYVMALAFARAGYLVVNVDYRLAPRDPYPAAVQDCAEAYGWVLDHVERHGGDPSRMAVAGESAGANLVSALVAMCCYPRPEPWAEAVFRRDAVPRAWLPYCGLLQVTDCERFRRNKPTLSTFINDRLMEVPHAYLGERPSIDTSLADPLLMFEQAEPIRPLPPCFATVGTADPLLDDTRRLGRALEARGSLAEVRFYPGEIHAFHAFVWRKAARRCWRDTYRFLDEHLPARGGHRAPNPVHPGA